MAGWFSPKSAQSRHFTVLAVEILQGDLLSNHLVKDDVASSDFASTCLKVEATLVIDSRNATFTSIQLV